MAYSEPGVSESTIAVSPSGTTLDTVRSINASTLWLAVENLDAVQTVTVTLEGRLTAGTGSWFPILWNGIGVLSPLASAMDALDVFGISEIRVRASASGAGCDVKYSRRTGFRHDATRR